MNHFYETIHGNFDFQDIYSQAVREAGDNSILVEVGAYLGRSTAFLAVEVINSRKWPKVYVVDTWKGNLSEPDHMHEMGKLGGDAYPHFCKNMTKVLHVLTPMRMESVEAASTFVDGSIDFVFIDADHRYDWVRSDIDAWWPKVKPGGVLAGHDYDDQFPGVRQAVDESFSGQFEIRNKSWWVRKPTQNVGFKSTFTCDGVEHPEGTVL